jgi:hypothetical protein
MRHPARRKQDLPLSRRKPTSGLPGVAYRMIGNAYRAPKSFVILQRTNAVLAVAACEPAPVRVDCSALHRGSLFQLGGFS